MTVYPPRKRITMRTPPGHRLSDIASALPLELAGGRELNRVLVAGGAGFIGSHVCEALLDNGIEVVCVDNLVTGTVDNVAPFRECARFSLVIQDAGDPLAVTGPLDAVINLASPASPKDFARLPIATLKAGSHVTLNLLNLARATRARFLLASTSEVYGDALEHPQTESYWGHVNPIGPRSVYDEGKRFAEALVTAYRHEFGVDAIIVRLFNTYGPRMRADDGRLVPSFICQALTGRDLTVTGNGEQTRSLCYVDDLVGGLLAAVLSSHPGPVNLGNPDEWRVIDFARKVISMCDSPSGLGFVARPQDDPTRRCPDISLAKSALNWEPMVSQDDGLAATIAWFADHLVHS